MVEIISQIKHTISQKTFIVLWSNHSTQTCQGSNLTKQKIALIPYLAWDQALAPLFLGEIIRLTSLVTCENIYFFILKSTQRNTKEKKLVVFWKMPTIFHQREGKFGGLLQNFKTCIFLSEFSLRQPNLNRLWNFRPCILRKCFKVNEELERLNKLREEISEAERTNLFYSNVDPFQINLPKLFVYISFKLQCIIPKITVYL